MTAFRRNSIYDPAILQILSFAAFASVLQNNFKRSSIRHNLLPILLNMLPYTSGYSTPVPSPSSLHFHASLPSHLSTELALLQTFIKRASAQHRSQLFLQRMEGILRVGKSMLLHVRKLSEERKGETCIAWRWKGENLIPKVGQHDGDTHVILRFSWLIDLFR